MRDVPDDDEVCCACLLATYWMVCCETMMLRLLTSYVSLLQDRRELLEDDKWLKGDGKYFGSALLHDVLRDTGSLKASITPAKLAFVVWRMFLVICKEGVIATPKTTKLPSTAASTEGWYSELISFVAANAGKHWATHQVEGSEPYTTLLSIVLPDSVCFASICLELVC